MEDVDRLAGDELMLRCAMLGALSYVGIDAIKEVFEVTPSAVITSTNTSNLIHTQFTYIFPKDTCVKKLIIRVRTISENTPNFIPSYIVAYVDKTEKLTTYSVPIELDYVRGRYTSILLIRTVYRIMDLLYIKSGHFKPKKMQQS